MASFGTKQAWVLDQMAMSPTLHRAYFRERANPRADAGSLQGSVLNACGNGTRWHQFALTMEDEGKTLEMNTESGITQLVVDGVGDSTRPLSEPQPAPHLLHAEPPYSPHKHPARPQGSLPNAQFAPKRPRRRPGRTTCH